MRYLLDTNMLSALVPPPRGVVADGIRRVGEGRVHTSIVVAAELRFGVTRTGSEKLFRQIEAVLGSLPVGAWQVRYDRTYADVR